MPKIPTFTATGRPTADAPGVRTDIQVSPTATIGAALLPAAETITSEKTHASSLLVQCLQI